MTFLLCSFSCSIFFSSPEHSNRCRGTGGGGAPIGGKQRCGMFIISNSFMEVIWIQFFYCKIWFILPWSWDYVSIHMVSSHGGRTRSFSTGSDKARAHTQSTSSLTACGHPTTSNSGTNQPCVYEKYFFRLFSWRLLLHA
jgi:hypothetical protein